MCSAMSKPKELRCERCHLFYVDCENWYTSCTFHSGQFRSIVSGGSGLINMSQAKRWSCCKSVNPAEVGCKKDYHVEDTEFTKFLVASYAKIGNANSLTSLASGPSALHFPPKRVSVSNPDVTPSVDPIIEDVPKECPLENEVAARITGECGVVQQTHIVQPNDSLRKLSLLYDVAPDVIMHANEIFHERDIHARETLTIPSATIPKLPPPPKVDEESRKRKKVIVFMDSTKCRDSLEAGGYLESHNWDVSVAVSAYRSDVQWESVQIKHTRERECCF